jgi:chromosome segregation ATPase
MESREAQLETLLDERAQVSKQIESLQLGLPAGAGLKSFEPSLSTKSPRTAELDDKVNSDRFLEDSRKKSEVNEADTVEKHPSQNARRDEFERKPAYSAAPAPGEREALDAAKSGLAPIDRRIDGLLSEITQLRGEIERSDQDFQLASEAYENANRKYHDAPLTYLERNVALRQVSAALIPEQPVGPGALVNALLAGVLAIVFLGAGLLGLEILREIRSEWHGRIVEQDSESAGPRSV